MNQRQLKVLIAAGVFSASLLAGSAYAADQTGTTPIKMAKGKKKPAGHSCAGMNSCKGQGGCKTGDAGCKGKNSCKGKGGCATNGSKHS